MKSSLEDTKSALASLKKEQGYRTLNRLFDLHKALVTDGGEYAIDMLTADDFAFASIFTAAEADALLFIVSDSGMTSGDVTNLDQMLCFGWTSK